MKSIQITDSDNPPNQWRNTCKNYRNNFVVRRFLQSIWFHILREDGANTTSIWSQRNSFSNNDAFKKYESSGPPIGQEVDKFTYFGSYISSIESDFNIHLAKTWTTIDWSHRYNKMGFLLSCGCVNTTEWIHLIDADRRQRQKSE